MCHFNQLINESVNHLISIYINESFKVCSSREAKSDVQEVVIHKNIKYNRILTNKKNSKPHPLFLLPMNWNSTFSTKHVGIYVKCTHRCALSIYLEQSRLGLKIISLLQFWFIQFFCILNVEPGSPVEPVWSCHRCRQGWAELRTHSAPVPPPHNLRRYHGLYFSWDQSCRKPSNIRILKSSKSP